MEATTFTNSLISTIASISTLSSTSEFVDTDQIDTDIASMSTTSATFSTITSTVMSTSTSTSFGYDPSKFKNFDEEDGGLSLKTVLIIAVVVPTILLLAILLVLAACCIKKPRKSDGPAPHTNPTDIGFEIDDIDIEGAGVHTEREPEIDRYPDAQP